ncbi:MAG TPA: GNAT family N-acetyltransferase [Candidatus Dormibacteraeota bacterium]
MSLEVRGLEAGEFVARVHEQQEIFRDALRYGNLEPRVLAFPEIARRHAARDRFRAAGAFDARRLVGFTYGYTGAPGQWWHDRVAEALPATMRRRWLDHAFELVELHVLTRYHGRGLGGRLHDLLLEDASESTAVLSTPRAETNAMALYRKRGWEVLVEEMLFPGTSEPFRVLGLDLSARQA